MVPASGLTVIPSINILSFKTISRQYPQASYFLAQKAFLGPKRSQTGLTVLIA